MFFACVLFDRIAFCSMHFFVPALYIGWLDRRLGCRTRSIGTWLAYLFFLPVEPSVISFELCLPRLLLEVFSRFGTKHDKRDKRRPKTHDAASPLLIASLDRQGKIPSMLYPIPYRRGDAGVAFGAHAKLARPLYSRSEGTQSCCQIY